MESPLSSSEVLMSDPLTRTKTIFHNLNPAKGDEFVIEDRQDVTELVDTNKRLYNSFDERSKFGKGAFHRVASIPLNVFFDLWKQGRFRGAKLSHDDARWLDDPDNRFFRTRPGKMSK